MVTMPVFKLSFGTNNNTEKAPIFSLLSSTLGAEQMSSEKLRVDEAYPQVTFE